MAALQERFAAAKQAVELAGPRLALLKATTILALVVLRIQSKGLPGRAYSTVKVPTFFFYNKTLNAGGRAYIKANKTGTWAGLRGAQGLPTSFVNLTYSGMMIRSLTATEDSASGAVFRAKLIASDEQNARLVDYNITRYGNWLLPTPSEETEANAAVVAEINRIVANIFAA